MTLPSSGALPPGLPIERPADTAEARQEDAAGAAEQFEGLLIQQLWQTLRQTVSSRAFGASGAGGSTYFHFIDEAMSQSLTEAGGLGLREQLTSALGGVPGEAPDFGGELRGLAAYQAAQSGPRLAPVALGPATGVRVDGATGRLQGAARELLGSAEAAARWSKDGQLTTGELASSFVTPLGEGDLAAFNVRDAAGYAGEYKCNLFAFELARRAGFQVPLTGRRHGWGYPDPNRVTADAGDGRLQRDWARVVTGESAETLDAAVQSGSRGFLLTGAGSAGRSGHMAVVERVHEVRYDARGEVEQVVFDGWEARRTGARHLTRRTWNRVGTRGGTDVRGGFTRIEVLELLAPRSGPAEQPLSPRVGPSLRDAPGPNQRPPEENEAPESNFSSSSAPARPRPSLEAES